MNGAAIGIAVALISMLMTFVLKGVSPAILINMPSFFIIFGGTFGAVMATVGLKQFKKMPKLFMIAVKPPVFDSVSLRDQLVHFAERARKEGLLALEADVDKVGDPFVRRGLQMVIDGLEPETVEEVLELEVEAMRRRHALGINMFAVAAGYAPTFGILGAVMGLIAAMSHLSEPEKLGPGIAVAFIATLLAVFMANGVLAPVSGFLRATDDREVVVRQMVLTGILAIQAGDNPRIVAQKLASYLPPGSPEPAKPGAAAGSDSDAGSGGSAAAHQAEAA
jgi:chemotaxis protein MotA